MDKRRALFEILDQFRKGVINAEKMQCRIIALLKEGGVWEVLSKEESKVLRDFVAWYADMYQENKQPRPGIIGSIKDILDQVIKGEYRVKLESVRRKASELADILAKGE